MYTEKQDFRPNHINWFKGFCWLLVATQFALLFAAESGFMKLPFSFYISVILIVIGLTVLCLLPQLGLRLQINKTGIELRFWQYPMQTHQILWTDIKRLRILLPEELPDDVYWGIPNRDATHIYLLTDRRYKVLSIELLRGTQFFISISKSGELLDFLKSSYLLK